LRGIVNPRLENHLRPVWGHHPIFRITSESMTDPKSPRARARPPTRQMKKARALMEKTESYLFESSDPVAQYLERSLAAVRATISVRSSAWTGRGIDPAPKKSDIETGLRKVSGLFPLSQYCCAIIN
jgi:hypothetical protein